MQSLRLRWEDNNDKHKIEIRSTESESILIGRHHDHHITLNYPTVSRPHAEIFSQNKAWYIKNVSSVNPIYVGNRKVGPREKTILQAGVPFRVGPVWFQVTFKKQKTGPIGLKCRQCNNVVDHKPEGFCPWCGRALHGAQTVFVS